MAQIPPLRRILTEDFSEQSEWIGKLIQPLNEHMEKVVRALDKGLTISENTSGRIIDITLDGAFPLKLAWGLRSRPRTVIVGAVRKADGTAFTLTDAVQVQWQYNQSGELQIDAVTGVTPSATNKYILTLEVKTG